MAARGRLLPPPIPRKIPKMPIRILFFWDMQLLCGNTASAPSRMRRIASPCDAVVCCDRIDVWGSAMISKIRGLRLKRSGGIQVTRRWRIWTTLQSFLLAVTRPHNKRTTPILRMMLGWSAVIHTPALETRPSDFPLPIGVRFVHSRTRPARPRGGSGSGALINDLLLTQLLHLAPVAARKPRNSLCCCNPASSLPLRGFSRVRVGVWV